MTAPPSPAGAVSSTVVPLAPLALSATGTSPATFDPPASEAATDAFTRWRRAAGLPGHDLSPWALARTGGLAPLAKRARRALAHEVRAVADWPSLRALLVGRRLVDDAGLTFVARHLTTFPGEFLTLLFAEGSVDAVDAYWRNASLPTDRRTALLLVLLHDLAFVYMGLSKGMFTDAARSGLLTWDNPVGYAMREQFNALVQPIHGDAEARLAEYLLIVAGAIDPMPPTIVADWLPQVVTMDAVWSDPGSSAPLRTVFLRGAMEDQAACLLAVAANTPVRAVGMIHLLPTTRLAQMPHAVHRMLMGHPDASVRLRAIAVLAARPTDEESGLPI